MPQTKAQYMLGGCLIWLKQACTSTQVYQLSLWLHGVLYTWPALIHKAVWVLLVGEMVQGNKSSVHPKLVSYGQLAVERFGT